MNVRLAAPSDAGAWLELRGLLWPGSTSEHEREIAEYFTQSSSPSVCLVAEKDEGEGLLGFAEVRLRDCAEGCRTSPVGYLEGIFVAPAHRRGGLGAALARAAEAWAREQGCTEMASDREWENEVSGAFHEDLGYEEVDRIVCFRKSLEAA